MLRKYTLFFAGFLGLVLGSIGCVGSHHSDPPPQAGGVFDATWRIFDSQTAREVSCEAAGIVLLSLGTKDVNTGQEFYDDFACNSYGGTTDLFADSDYTAAFYAYADADRRYLVTSYFFPDPYYPIYSGETTYLPLARISY